MRRKGKRAEEIIGIGGIGNSGCLMRKEREGHEGKDRVRREGKGGLAGKKDKGSLTKKDSHDQKDPIGHRGPKGKMHKNDSSRGRQERDRNKRDFSKDRKDGPRENNTRNLAINNWRTCIMKAM